MHKAIRVTRDLDPIIKVKLMECILATFPAKFAALILI